MHKQVFCQYVTKNNISRLQTLATEFCLSFVTAPKKDENNEIEPRRVQGDHDQKTRKLKLLEKKLWEKFSNLEKNKLKGNAICTGM